MPISACPFCVERYSPARKCNALFCSSPLNPQNDGVADAVTEFGIEPQRCYFGAVGSNARGCPYNV